jgi:hypothetical protein
MIKLIRVKYGKLNPNLAPELREYQINGKGPVGCLSEYKEMFPNEEFEIIDEFNKNDTKI